MIEKFKSKLSEAFHAVLVHQEVQRWLVLNISLVANSTGKGIANSLQFIQFHICCSYLSTLLRIKHVHNFIPDIDLDVSFAFGAIIVKT